MKAIDYLPRFKAEKSQQYSVNTILSYMADINQFIGFINKDLEDIKRDDIEGFISHVLVMANKHSGKSIRPQTVNKKLVAIRRFIGWLNSETDIKIHTEIKSIKIQHCDYLSNDLLSSSDFDRLIRATEKVEELQGKQARALFYGLYYTGMRISELLQLKVADIEKMDVWVKGKGDKYREIPITNRLKLILLEYAKERNLSNDDFVFVNLYNKNIMSRQTAHRIIKKYGGKAKIKLKRVHVHNLRHLFCLNLLDKGATIEEVADLAGHSNINTTRIYTRKTKDELRKTVELL